MVTRIKSIKTPVTQEDINASPHAGLGTTPADYVDGQAEHAEAHYAKLSARKTPVADVVEKDSALKTQLHGYVDDLFGPNTECSVQRLLAAGIVGIAASLGVGALGGTLFGLMMIGASVLAWPTFIVLAIYVIGMLITMWLSSKMFDYAYRSVIDKSLETACEKIRDGVTERFVRVTQFFTSRSAA